MTKAGYTILFPLAAAVLLGTAPSSPAQTASPPSRAVLVRGTLSVRGVPHLPVNSIAALYGEYLWRGAAVRAWVIRDEIFLAEDWTAYQIRSVSGEALRSYSRKTGTPAGEGLVIAVRDASFWILLEFQPGAEDLRAFAAAFVSRLVYFAAQAKSPSDLSLPAVLELR